MISVEDLHWMAGLFEGEGSIGIRKPAVRNMGSLIVGVPNTDESLVRPFHEAWGGSVHYVGLKAPRKPFWRWIATARDAEAFLLAMYPLFRSAKYQQRAVIGLDFQAQKRMGSGANRTPEYLERQWRFYEHMRDLNIRGVEHADQHRRRAS